MSNLILDAFASLGRKINKVAGQQAELETQEGVVSEKFPELTLDLDNDSISKLTSKWEKSWIESEVYTKWIKDGQDNEDYWIGKQFTTPRVNKDRQLVDNVIFESLETYLPQTTRRNPDPMVLLKREVEQTPENLKYATDLQKKLGEIADELKLRLKIKKVGRHWAIYLIGVGKPGWDLDRDIPTLKIIRPKKIILDPNATIDEDGYTGEFVGEYRKLQASIMLKLLEGIGGEEGAVEVIKKLAVDSSGNEALGTDIGFIEWWTDQYMCWTIGKDVLLKKKNPHWNYEKEIPAMADEVTGEIPVNQETGQPEMTQEPGFNHFPVPKKPYIFLSVFNLGKQPVDDTSLIGQNLSGQDLVNKRLKQIDKNADNMNGGFAVSGERSGITQQQAKGVAEAARRGGVIWIPGGNVNEAVVRLNGSSLPSDIYNQMADTRIRIRDIFGTRGSSAAGLESEKTVRGKLQFRSLDTDRIGGGVSEYLEQFADDTYNWFVQLLYVYDDQYGGQNHPPVTISVKEGSLLPKDSLTMANQAVDLASAGKMALIDLYKALDYPNPEEVAANVWLEANAPEILFANDPRVQQVIQARQQAQGEKKPPSQSINFKDLPPEGKAQMAAEVGIDLHPEAIAAHDEAIEERSMQKQAIPQTNTEQ